jgi:hypothetical protein
LSDEEGGADWDGGAEPDASSSGASSRTSSSVGGDLGLIHRGYRVARVGWPRAARDSEKGLEGAAHVDARTRLDDATARHSGRDMEKKELQLESVRHRDYTLPFTKQHW